MGKKLLLLLLFAQAAFSQSVAFLEINDTMQKPRYQEFIYLNDGTDLSGSVRVATLKSVGSQDNPVLLYNLIKVAAQKVGANSFRLVKFDKYEDRTAELTLAAFYTNDSILGENFKRIEKNKVHIFGDANLLGNKTQSCKVNGKKYEIQPGRFLTFDILPGENLDISKGGFTGTHLTIEGKMGKMSRFYSLSGFEVTGGEVSQGGTGVLISTGDIDRVEQNLALLLLKIFDEQP